MKSKALPLGTVWTARAKVQVIDLASGRWLTLAACADTPNAIRDALAAARRGRPGATLWVYSDTRGRYIP